jgi:AmmeMemoRadiSam system protein A
LSHYLTYEEAEKTDTKTCLAIDTLDSASIPHQSACGYYPLRGFLHYARKKKFLGRLLDLRNSGDTAGSKDKVVGYGSYHFYQNLHFADYCAGELLFLATEALRLKAEENRLLTVDYQNYNDLVQIRAPTFVTLKKKGMLRGCMGNLQAKDKLAENIIDNSVKAGFFDPRFPAITPQELEELSLSISILSPLVPMTFEDEDDLKSQLRTGIDGLVLQWGTHQATFLPSVWDSLHDKDEFIEHLKMKMNVSSDFWSKEMRAFRYTTEIIERLNI